MRTFLALLLCISPSEGFFLNDDRCFGVCSCYSNIDCDRKQLTAVPTFDLPVFLLNKDYTHMQTSLGLNDNNITSIPFGAFHNISKLNMPLLSIYLGSNNISIIHNGAFTGLESIDDVGIYLDHNQLTTIPLDLTRMTNLFALDLRYNPIQTVSGPVIAAMFASNEITRLSLSSYEMLKKVMEVQDNSLEYLVLDGMTTRKMDPGLFQRSKTVPLSSITIEKSSFDNVTEVLCNLDLNSLTISGCPNLGDNVLQGCPQTSLWRLTIYESNLTNAWTPSALYNSPIRYLTVLGKFDRVPTSVFRHWPNLQSLTVGSNITIIEKSDFEGLRELHDLNLRANPIHLIADQAFATNTKLADLHLHYNNDIHLTSIPSSLQNLTSLSFVELPNMKCTCTAMGGVKGWHADYVSGQCTNIHMGIGTYIETKLTLCP
ncbi:leucine-rich repeats and immunoglobulin-like domains protein 1 [Mya arenaria]|uniref:leucine-rich repeats and immunoglobulin-like domains protein 1 n=1 Tax=Mya arenaria TaxID=6604 RepID=UPI0022DF07C7|nr:leucine-rich repeats and immunoglobulin-like domains protein 1 [Mya arenaria]